MRKLLLTFIGLITLWSAPVLVYAQASDTPSDCDTTLYENEFNCSRESVNSYCTLSASVWRSGPDYNLYEEAYCDTIRDDDDDIYEIIAEQFNVEIKDVEGDDIEQILKNPIIYSTDYTQAGGLISDLYRRVKAAYDREKILYQTQKSLESQFTASEIWVNGSLLDSPFDLIVDLNLIEMILFGSEAQWNDDVYAWPSGGTDADNPGIGDSGTPAGQIPGAATTPTTPSTSTTPTSGLGASPADYECVSDDKLKDIIDDKISGGSSTSGSGTSTGTSADSQPGKIPKDCGNKKKDSGEECDDGNNTAGDGCSEACKLEITTSLSCRDIEAVTFKKLATDSASGTGGTGGTGTGGTGTGTGTGTGSGSGTAPPISCPPGSTATKKTPASTAPPTQSANYPGPFVGGVLKKMPDSKKTDCPPGTSYIEVTVGAEKYGTCMSTSICADFDKMRFKLFPTYKDLKAKKDKTTADEAKLAGMEAVEAAICIKVSKVDRPESPYSTNEGCIDCHIRAMVDTMDKLLQKNVTPLENSMQSWGTSNRWGPTLSFNLNVISQRLMTPLTHHDLRPFPTDKEKADLHAEQSKSDGANQKDPNTKQASASAVATETVADKLKRNDAKTERTKAVYLENLKNYKLVGDASGDQIAHTKIIAKLNELKASFAALQGMYLKFDKATKLHEKEECKIQ